MYLVWNFGMFYLDIMVTKKGNILDGNVYFFVNLEVW